MTDIKKLKQDWQEAQKATALALDKEKAARDAFFTVVEAKTLGELAARGINVGDKCTYEIERWNGPNEVRVAGFAGVEICRYRGTPRLKFFKLKKDGTVGKQSLTSPYDLKPDGVSRYVEGKA